MYKQNLALNNQQWLIYHKTKQNKLFYGVFIRFRWPVIFKDVILMIEQSVTELSK